MYIRFASTVCWPCSNRNFVIRNYAYILHWIPELDRAVVLEIDFVRFRLRNIFAKNWLEFLRIHQAERSRGTTEIVSAHRGHQLYEAIQCRWGPSQLVCEASLVTLPLRLESNLS